MGKIISVVQFPLVRSATVYNMSERTIVVLVLSQQKITYGGKKLRRAARECRESPTFIHPVKSSILQFRRKPATAREVSTKREGSFR